MDLEYRRRQDPERRKAYGSRFLGLVFSFCLCEDKGSYLEEIPWTDVVLPLPDTG